jgi:hypothetical protein
MCVTDLIDKAPRVRVLLDDFHQSWPLSSGEKGRRWLMHATPSTASPLKPYNLSQAIIHSCARRNVGDVGLPVRC